MIGCEIPVGDLQKGFYLFVKEEELSVLEKTALPVSVILGMEEETPALHKGQMILVEDVTRFPEVMVKDLDGFYQFSLRKDVQIELRNKGIPENGILYILRPPFMGNTLHRHFWVKPDHTRY